VDELSKSVILKSFSLNSERLFIFVFE